MFDVDLDTLELRKVPSTNLETYLHYLLTAEPSTLPARDIYQLWLINICHGYAMGMYRIAQLGRPRLIFEAHVPKEHNASTLHDAQRRGLITKGESSLLRRHFTVRENQAATFFIRLHFPNINAQDFLANLSGTLGYLEGERWEQIRDEAMAYRKRGNRPNLDDNGGFLLRDEAGLDGKRNWIAINPVTGETSPIEFMPAATNQGDLN